MEKDSVKNLFIVTSIFIIFIVFLNFLSIYIEKNYVASPTCRTFIPLSFLINLLITVALFSGTAVTLFFVKRSEHRKKIVYKDALSTLRFLNNDEREVVKFIINQGSSTTQSKIVKNVGLSRVKVSRILSHLESKQIIIRKEYGNTNQVELSKDLKDLFTCKVCNS